MKLHEVILPLLLLHNAACTHLETCDCHEIKAIVNKTVEQQVQEIKAIVNTTVEEAVARLEYKLNLNINTAISRVNATDSAELSDLENTLKSTMVSLLKPIQRQLDYHLPSPPHQKFSEDNPAESCKVIYDAYPDAPSGHYWIKTSSSPIRVYCKMNATCEHLKGGWMRVAYLDMRNSSHQCPSGFSLTTRSSNPRRVCDITRNGCVSTRFTVHGKRYSHVHGRIIAYQNGYASAFYYQSRPVDQSYVFGVSLTHGQNPRKHIWTFAGAADESTYRPEIKCPCINTNIHSSTIRIASFIGNDYFCDTSLSNRYSSYSKGFYPSDPLWDGQGCGPTNACCSVPSECNNSPPWFIKNLSSPTTDEVEMRLCRPDGSGSTPIEIVELYVQ